MFHHPTILEIRFLLVFLQESSSIHQMNSTYYAVPLLEYILGVYNLTYLKIFILTNLILFSTF